MSKRAMTTADKMSSVEELFDDVEDDNIFNQTYAGVGGNPDMSHDVTLIEQNNQEEKENEPVFISGQEDSLVSPRRDPIDSAIDNDSEESKLAKLLDENSQLTKKNDEILDQIHELHIALRIKAQMESVHSKEPEILSSRVSVQYQSDGSQTILVTVRNNSSFTLKQWYLELSCDPTESPSHILPVPSFEPNAELKFHIMREDDSILLHTPTRLNITLRRGFVDFEDGEMSEIIINLDTILLTYWSTVSERKGMTRIYKCIDSLLITGPSEPSESTTATATTSKTAFKFSFSTGIIFALVGENHSPADLLKWLFPHLTELIDAKIAGAGGPPSTSEKSNVSTTATTANQQPISTTITINDLSISIAPHLSISLCLCPAAASSSVVNQLDLLVTVEENEQQLDNGRAAAGEDGKDVAGWGRLLKEQLAVLIAEGLKQCRVVPKTVVVQAKKIRVELGKMDELTSNDEKMKFFYNKILPLLPFH